MEKVDIIAGLKSALSRGYSLEFSKKSFVNAGYSSQDVDDSANALMNGSTSTVNVRSPTQETNISTPAQTSIPSQPTTVNNPSYQQLPSQSTNSQSPAYKPLPKPMTSDYKRTTDSSGQPKAKGLGLVILLVIILIIVLGVLGLFIFKKDLVETYLRSWGII